MKPLTTYINESQNETDMTKVMKWLKDNISIVDKKKVEIVDGRINIEGKVFVHSDVKELPYPFGTVIGVFNCNHSKIKSLKNCPEYVDGCFICDECPNLQSLKGAPKEVTEYFCCSYPFDQDDVRKVCKVGWEIYC